MWQAFNRLSTTRPVGMGQGPISYLEMVRYANEMEMGPGQKEFLWDVIKKLDTIYMKLVAPKPPPKKTPQRR